MWAYVRLSKISLMVIFCIILLLFYTTYIQQKKYPVSNIAPAVLRIFPSSLLLVKQYDLRIIAIVYNRASSLLRLLNSLNLAEYGDDQIKLEVWIDRSVDGRVHEDTLNMANNFTFYHGDYTVHTHIQHVGIYGQWLTTWNAQANSSEIAVILEDDLTVSPHFYTFLKLVHGKYDHSSDINGYSLQGISIKHGGQGLISVPKQHSVFLYQVLGTWGFSPSTSKWIDFIKWFKEVVKDMNFNPYVPGNVATTWYQAFQRKGKADGMWSMWHIYYAWKNKQYTLYSNYGDHLGLTVNWKESGLHYVAAQKGASNPVLVEWRSEYEQLPNRPVYTDLAGKITLP